MITDDAVRGSMTTVYRFTVSGVRAYAIRDECAMTVGRTHGIRVDLRCTSGDDGRASDARDTMIDDGGYRCDARSVRDRGDTRGAR